MQTRGIFPRILVVASLVVIELVAAGPLALAATITVNSLADGAPKVDARCTLREAVINANNDNQAGSTDCLAGSGTDRIAFAVRGTSRLAAGELELTSNVVIDGPGADKLTLSGEDGTRVFTIGGSAAVLISGLHLTHGNAANGGAVAVLEGSSLTMSDCLLTDNVAADGGAIWNFGRLVLVNSMLRGNTGNANNGGGAIISGGTLDVTSSSFWENTAGVGGAILNLGVATIADSFFFRNSATSGGALQNQRVGTVTVVDSNFLRNTAEVGGNLFNNGGILETANVSAK
jgi:CSLREA domain-containing protein